MRVGQNVCGIFLKNTVIIVSLLSKNVISTYLWIAAMATVEFVTKTSHFRFVTRFKKLLIYNHLIVNNQNFVIEVVAKISWIAMFTV